MTITLERFTLARATVEWVLTLNAADQWVETNHGLIGRALDFTEAEFAEAHHARGINESASHTQERFGGSDQECLTGTSQETLLRKEWEAGSLCHKTGIGTITDNLIKSILCLKGELA